MAGSDDDLARQEIRLRELERKSTFEATQNEIRRQKDTLQHLRREQKELRAARELAARGTTAKSDAFERKEAELLQTKVFAQRRQLDDLVSSNAEKSKHIRGISEKSADLLKEAQPILQDDSPLTQKIRTLENRLDKSLIKHNEAMSIRRTYEQILKRLRDERVGFDNQLAAIEKTLKAKEHDYIELQNMAHDAHHAREIAKAEVVQFKAAYAAERAQKLKQLEERKSYVQQRTEQLKQQKNPKAKKQQEEDKSGTTKTQEEETRRRDLVHSTVELRTEEEQERLQQYAESYRRIKDVTRANTVDEVIAKFIAQEDTHRTLVDMTRDVQARIDQLQTQRAELRRKVEENKYSGSGQLGSRRIVDEFETHLTEATVQLEKASKDYEKVHQTFIGIKAGVEHLAEKLSSYRTELPIAAVNDDNIVDVLKQCEQKLQTLVDEAAAGTESTDDVIAHADIELPPNNVRVKTGIEAEEEEEDRRQDGKAEVDDTNEDDPHERAALKSMSYSAVERETKKARKRGRKKEGEGDQ